MSAVGLSFCKPRVCVLLTACVLGFVGCSTPIKIQQVPAAQENEDPGEGKFFGEEGILGLINKQPEQPTIGVNEFLWQASVSFLSTFIPLNQVDPFGGVILTDWYSPESTPDSRFRLNVFMKGKELRSDSLSVTVFRQRRNGNTWVDTAVGQETKIQIENAILSKARELRAAAIQAGSAN